MQDCPSREEVSECDEHSCSVFCKLQRFDWYWGNITRPEVERLLLKHPGHFIIRACNDNDHILCASFRLNPYPRYEGLKGISHMRLKHYKGMFSLDRKDYVPVEKIPEHCEKVGRDMDMFDATVLKRDESSVLEMTKIFCKRRES